MTTHPDTSSLSNSRGTDLISLLFSLQTSVAKVKLERSEYAETILGLRPLSYKVPRMALPSIQISSLHIHSVPALSLIHILDVYKRQPLLSVS